MNDRDYAVVAAKLDMISQCKHEIQLDMIAGQIVQILGGRNYMFLLYQPERKDLIKATFRYLIGCAPEWSQHYVARRWYMNDPDLMYAKGNSVPVTASEIVLRTDGQRAIRAHEEGHGFRSKLIVPAHAPNGHRVGVLFVGTEQERAEGERTLLKHRVFYRMLAIEMLDWYARALREDAVRFFDLAAKETAVLELVHRGYSAADIADELELAVPTIYSYFSRLNEKFAVKHISMAVKTALFMGILG